MGRDFEQRPLTPDEFSMTLIACTDQDVTAYLVWIAEELNRRGLTIGRGLFEQLAGTVDVAESGRCTYIRSGGNRCQKKVKAGLVTCSAHTPEAIAKAKELAIKNEADYILSRQEEIMKLTEEVQIANRKRIDAEKEYHTKRQMLVGLDRILSQQEDLNRIIACYDVAKESGDANAMLEAQKTLYYARKRMGITDEANKWVKWESKYA